jgi:hypothetical protein
MRGQSRLHKSWQAALYFTVTQHSRLHLGCAFRPAPGTTREPCFLTYSAGILTWADIQTDMPRVREACHPMVIQWLDVDTCILAAMIVTMRCLKTPGCFFVVPTNLMHIYTDYWYTSLVRVAAHLNYLQYHTVSSSRFSFGSSSNFHFYPLDNIQHYNQALEFFAYYPFQQYCKLCHNRIVNATRLLLLSLVTQN